MDTSQVLEEALELLGEHGEGWSHQAWAFDSDGFAIPTLDPRATTFCVNGAIAKVIGSERIGKDYEDAVFAVKACITAKSVVAWNRDPHTSFAEVRGVLRRSIACTQMRESRRREEVDQ